MPKKSVSRREVLKKAGAITASTFGASFALAGEPEKAPGTSAEATVLDRRREGDWVTVVP